MIKSTYVPFICISQNRCIHLEPLLPSLRKRKRYIAVEVISDAPVQRNAFIAAVSQAGCAVLGDVGFAVCGISVLGFEDNVGIVKCWHTSVSQTIGVLTFMTWIDGQKVIVRAAGVSGTVKGAQIKFLQKGN
ncbi:ribonuclease P protein subunit Rpp14 [Methanimicrococcus blatticola]|uniref:Ribonuclease P protein component 2 n=1 Tax=Methanimicrococcus blatticola TaxID=91560 RepID=A0A484F7H4_9EURY|nr:ribonuclease P protein subunit Rpp14 [Methanimicrococcus blatticola]